jgi:hypothetical protein
VRPLCIDRDAVIASEIAAISRPSVVRHAWTKQMMIHFAIFMLGAAIGIGLGSLL